MTKYMKKQTHKKRRLNVHPIHFHLGVYVALATVLITCAKSSSEIIKTAYAMPVYYDGVNALHLRDAKTLHGHTNLSMMRRADVMGQ